MSFIPDQENISRQRGRPDDDRVIKSQKYRQHWRPKRRYPQPFHAEAAESSSVAGRRWFHYNGADGTALAIEFACLRLFLEFSTEVCSLAALLSSVWIGTRSRYRVVFHVKFLFVLNWAVFSVIFLSTRRRPIDRVLIESCSRPAVWPKSNESRPDALPEYPSWAGRPPDHFHFFQMKKLSARSIL